MLHLCFLLFLCCSSTVRAEVEGWTEDESWNSESWTWSWSWSESESASGDSGELDLVPFNKKQAGMITTFSYLFCTPTKSFYYFHLWRV